MSHLPPTNDTIPDVLTNYRDQLAVGLYTRPVAPELVTQLSDLLGDPAFPEPSSMTFPGYARLYPTWAQLAADPQFAAIAGQAAWVAAEAPPAELPIQGWFLLSATSGSPAMLTFGAFPAAVPVAARGDGLVVPIVVTASQAGPGQPASVSSTGSPVRVSRSQPGRNGYEFRGQDRRMVEQLLKAIAQTQAHDDRVGKLSPNTRRSSIPILDPDDPGLDLAAAAQVLAERCYVLLSL